MNQVELVRKAIADLPVARRMRESSEANLPDCPKRVAEFAVAIEEICRTKQEEDIAAEITPALPESISSLTMHHTFVVHALKWTYNPPAKKGPRVAVIPGTRCKSFFDRFCTPNFREEVLDALWADLYCDYTDAVVRGDLHKQKVLQFMIPIHLLKTVAGGVIGRLVSILVRGRTTTSSE